MGSEAAAAKQSLAVALREKGALGVANAGLEEQLAEQRERGEEWRTTAGTRSQRCRSYTWRWPQTGGRQQAQILIGTARMLQCVESALRCCCSLLLITATQ